MSHRILAALFIVGITASLSAQTTPSFELKNNSTNAPYYTAYGTPLAQGDFNNDGKPDLVTVQSVYLGNGDGTFQAPLKISAISRTLAMEGLEAVDLNHDGNLDLVALTNQTLYIFYGNGDGTLQTPQTYTTAGTAISLAAADFNRDGYPDIAVGSYEGSVQIFNNTGGRSFARGNMYSLGASVGKLAAGDVNANGNIALAALTDKAAFVLWGDGHGVFHPVQLATYALGTAAALNIGDLNQDGNADIMISFNCGVYSPPARIPYHCIGIDVFYGRGNRRPSIAVRWKTTA